MKNILSDIGARTIMNFSIESLYFLSELEADELFDLDHEWTLNIAAVVSWKGSWFGITYQEFQVVWGPAEINHNNVQTEFCFTVLNGLDMSRESRQLSG